MNANACPGTDHNHMEVQARSLKAGDVIEFGGQRFRFRAVRVYAVVPHEYDASAVTLYFTDLNSTLHYLLTDWVRVQVDRQIEG